MYTAYIGKQLIKALNQRDGTHYSPRTFFDEVFFPLFFANERYLLNANNSPVDQAYKMKAKTPLTAEVLEIQRGKIHTKIATGESDASIFLGGPSLDATASTSGQVTNLPREMMPEDIYASWLGASLGVGVEGGFSLLIDAPEVLLVLYEGWKTYRRLLTQTPALKPMQINTWNGQWLAYRLGKNHNPALSVQWETDKDGGALTTQTWVQLFFAVSYRYRQESDRKLNAYVYAFGQMNRTIGFIRLNLPRVRYLHDLFSQIVEPSEGLTIDDFETLYHTEFGFKRACQFGEIGLKALQPKDLRSYVEGKSPVYTDSDRKKQLAFRILETWIIAMLNNQELIKKTEEIARSLHTFSLSGGRGKTTHDQKVKTVTDSKTRREFIEGLTAVLETDDSQADLFNQAVHEITVMPADSIPLFLTLLRFKYAYVTRKAAKTE